MTPTARTGIASLVLVSFAIIATSPSPLNAPRKEHRDRELFLAGAKAVAGGQYVQARILLNTLVNTYPDSRFAGEAKLLVFYSYAREGGARNEGALKILREAEEYLKGRELGLPTQ